MERNGWMRVEGVTFRVERGRMLSAQRRQTGRRHRTATPLTWPAARRGARFGMVFGRAPTAGRATVGRRPRPVAGRAAAAGGAVFFFFSEGRDGRVGAENRCAPCARQVHNLAFDLWAGCGRNRAAGHAARPVVARGTAS